MSQGPASPFSPAGGYVKLSPFPSAVQDWETAAGAMRPAESLGENGILKLLGHFGIQFPEMNRVSCLVIAINDSAIQAYPSINLL